MTQSPPAPPAEQQPVAAEAAPPRSRSRWSPVVVTALALLSALIVGAVLIAVGDEKTRTALGYFFQYPQDTVSYGWSAVSSAYIALFEGAIVDPATFSSGSLTQILGPISETLLSATPLMCAGLSVALAFRAGLFNIGAQGQIIMAAIFAGYVGFAWSMPIVLHVIVAVIAGLIGGALYGGIAGVLKARTGAHEVITTIMLNYVALNLLGWLLSVSWFQAPPFSQAISRNVKDTARLPHLLGGDLRVHFGLLLALAAAAGTAWLLDRSTLGFRLRAVGANPAAARTAGMKVEPSYTTVMLLAGGLAGLAGVSQILGTNSAVTGTVDAGYGFDGITVALLGRATPWGTVLAALLFGALRAGSLSMQARTGVPVDLVTVLQALIVLFIAAPQLVRTLFWIRADRAGTGQVLAKGWNG
jgi:general nucleoside transport system permease protein